jgi:hypothetical protein
MSDDTLSRVAGIVEATLQQCRAATGRLKRLGCTFRPSTECQSCTHDAEPMASKAYSLAAMTGGCTSACSRDLSGPNIMWLAEVGLIENGNFNGQVFVKSN